MSLELTPGYYPNITIVNGRTETEARGVSLQDDGQNYFVRNSAGHCLFPKSHFSRSAAEFINNILRREEVRLVL